MATLISLTSDGVVIESMIVMQDPVVRAQAGKSPFGYDSRVRKSNTTNRLCYLLQVSRFILGLLFRHPLSCGSDLNQIMYINVLQFMDGSLVSRTNGSSASFLIVMS